MDHGNTGNKPLKGSKGMIFAAGLGTRLKPFTDNHPKALAPVNGKPLLQRNIEYFKSYGIEDIIINIHHFAEQITGFLKANGDFGCRIVTSHEKEQPLETGGGLMYASWFFEKDEKPFFVMNADILTDLDLARMHAYHEHQKPLATLAVTHRKSSRNLLFDDDMQLCGWANSSTGETRMSREDARTLHACAFTCVHIIEPAFLTRVRQTGKFSVIDTYLDLARENTIKGYLHNNDRVVDVGRPESITEAEKYFR